MRHPTWSPGPGLVPGVHARWARPPVSVSGISYDLIRQLEPAGGQIIDLGPSAEITGSIKVGSQIQLETGIIRDRNGNPVPDGTPVEFHLRYPTESLALAPKIGNHRQRQGAHHGRA